MAGTIAKGLIGKQDESLWDGTDTATYTRITSSGYRLTLNKMVHPGVDVCSVYGGGSLRTGDVINLALAAIGTPSAAVPLYLSRKTWTIDQNLSIPADFVLELEVGTIIDTDKSICDGGTAWTWTNHAGSVYKLDQTIHEPANIFQSGTALTEVANISSIVAAGQWAWEGNKLYVRTSGSTNPDTLANGALQASYSVEILGPFVAERVKCFSSYSTIIFGNGAVDCVFPEWWDDDVAKAAASIASAEPWSATGNTGCIVALGAKTYDISKSVVEYPGVILEGLGPAATCLKLTTAANCPVVTSYNFAGLTGSGETLASEGVPYLFGLRNLRIDGNKTNQVGNNNGVSFFGKGFIVDNVIIHDCSGHGWYSECGRNTSIATWQDDTLASVDGLVTRDNTLDGFHCEGGHDMYLGHLESHGNGGYGVYNTRTDYTDGTFTFGHIHTYGNTLGNYFGHEVFGNFLESEDKLKFHVDEGSDPPGGDSGTNYEPNISIVYVGTDAAGVMLDIERPNMNIGQLHAEVRGAAVTKAVYIHEEQVSIGILNVEGNTYGAIGLHVAADNVSIGGGVVQHLGTAGGLGIKLGDTAVPVRRCSIDCNVMDCDTSFFYVDNAGFGNEVSGQYWVNTGQDLLDAACVEPANDAEKHDDFDIHSDIQGTPMTYKRTRCFTSKEFKVDSVAVVTVVITHNLIWTPDLDRDIQVSIQQTGGTDTWAVGFVKVVAADATTVTAKVNVTAASAVPNEVARLTLWARN